jgi:OFA family oxalate/formate antiporter-like MFS transporter
VKENLSPGEMLRTPQFYVLWLMYFIGTSVGLTAIAESSPQVQDLARDAALSGGAALGLMSLFNGLGRLSWGALSDRIGRRGTVVAMCAVSSSACLLFLRDARSFWQVLVGLCMVGFAYGGYLAVMPSFTADYFGPRNVGANYGILFSAWGLCGFIVPGYFASIMEQARQSGNLAAGYNQVYVSLAVLALVGLALAFLARKPGGATPRRAAAVRGSEAR